MHGASSVVWFVVLLVLGILAVNAVAWTVIILWMRRRYRAARDALVTALEPESVIRPLEKGSYQGATAPGYTSVRYSGTIALSRQRLVFLTITGKLIEIPLNAVTGVREALVFKRSAANDRMHLIVGTESGEIGFFVPDNAAWINAIADACPQVAAPRPASDATNPTPLVFTRRRGRAAVPILAIVFTSIGLLLGLAAGIGGAIAAVSLSGDQHADGTVVDLSYGGRSYDPVVEFTGPSGNTVRFTSWVGSNPPAWDVGEHVDVLYDPDNPRDAVIDAYWQKWFLPTLFGLIGTPFLLLGIGLGVPVLVGRKRSRSNPARHDDDPTPAAAATGEREARG
jgi:hypothetical protein